MTIDRIGGLGAHGDHQLYCERIAQECVECKEKVLRIVSRKAQNPANAEDAVAMAILSVMQHAEQNEKRIENTEAFLLISARRKLLDLESNRRPAGKLKTDSLDAEQNAGLLNQVVDSEFAETIHTRMAIDQFLERTATSEERRLFKMLEAGLDSSEIAAHLDVSEAMARRRVRLLKAKLRTVL